MNTTTAQEQLLRQRYGSGEHPEIAWNESIAQLVSHRSVRSFLPEPVTDKEVSTIVAAAQSASSSSNQHYWSVIAVRDPQTKSKLAEFTQGPSLKDKGYNFVSDAPLVLLWVADMSRNLNLLGQDQKEGKIVDYLDALVMTSVDTALAAQNGMVAAEAIGLGGVFLGSLRNCSREIAELMKLPQHTYMVFGMAVGKPNPESRSSIRPRPAQEVVLHQERYSAPVSEDWIDNYEQAFHEFRTGAGLREKSWRESVQIATTASYLDGRENLREAIENQGYSLK